MTARYCCLSPGRRRPRHDEVGGWKAGVLLGRRSNAMGLGFGSVHETAKNMNYGSVAGCTIKLLISGSLRVTYSNRLYGVEW